MADINLMVEAVRVGRARVPPSRAMLVGISGIDGSGPAIGEHPAGEGEDGAGEEA